MDERVSRARLYVVTSCLMYMISYGREKCEQNDSSALHNIVQKVRTNLPGAFQHILVVTILGGVVDISSS